MITEKKETGLSEQQMIVSPEDWDIAVMHGQYSQGEDREDLVTFRRIDLAAYLGQMRVEQESKIRGIKNLLSACKYPLQVAKIDADNCDDHEDVELLSRLIRDISAALRS